ncbi:MAG: hypothetical protein IJK78_07220, partial [Bacteroidales bacterium]|nr:hypothetical protein [Bacteroidales bacterium]
HICTISCTLFLLHLLMVSCIKPKTCHQAVKVVNNSENTISVRNLSMSQHDGVEYVWLFDKGQSVSPQETATIQVIIRRCLEEYRNTPMYYILPEGYPSIKTTRDSLFIVYDILKTIDLDELGVDSLVRTDYTVYYP